MKQIIQLSSLIFLTILFSCGVTKSPYPIKAELFADTYKQKQAAHDRTYKGEWVEIEGKIGSFYKAKSGEMVILIYNKDQTSGVQAELLRSNQQIQKPLKIGQQVRIVGLCKGFNENVILTKAKIY